ncbi:DUF3560 domain-containing protein [Streptomyces yaizuensis]|uniref:DUF3560 domain-containing protein n=1 Tax=Streptomyces yaizuensis TaxID=2989713 RepID=A0AA86IZ45_9ACTN|nr:DUF3560 domain-containing protein [Streptomyces sp. YSPA8]BDT39501.1 DUF3560 domain-containing protein [Streptomyces sp. YSPA8]
MTNLLIEHTHADGTLVHGTDRGDAAGPILKRKAWGRTLRQGFRWGRELECWYLPHSRDNAAYRPNLEQLADELRAAGFTVELTIDNTERRSFAEAEADRVERAEDRADRFGGYADNATARSKGRYRAAHDIADGIPMGQPILVGHHSQRRAERDRDRLDSHMRSSIEEGRKAGYWSGRAEAAAGYEAFRKDPRRTLRRIDKLNADLRAVERWQRGESAHGYKRSLTPDTVEELRLRHEELTEEIAYWRQVIADAEAEGFKVWTKDDFQKGNFVLGRYGTWYEVLRVNAKSVTIPHIHNMEPVVTKESNRDPDWTWLLPYDAVRGRAADQAEAEARPQKA